MREEILDLIRQKRDENYKEFNTKLIPGVDTSKVIGVRLPDMRAIAKELAKKDFRKYIKELPKDCYYEERMIHGIVISYAKISMEEWEKLTAEFVPHIKDWATCDSCAMGMKIVQKNREEGWRFLQKFLKAKEEYHRRFGVVMLLSHYINESYIDKVLEEMEKVEKEEYYVMMAVAWTLSVCYIKFPEKTESFFQRDTLDPTTQNKAIQKIRESRRVPKEEKDRLLQYKKHIPKK